MIRRLPPYRTGTVRTDFLIFSEKIDAPDSQLALQKLSPSSVTTVLLPGGSMTGNLTGIGFCSTRRMRPISLFGIAPGRGTTVFIGYMRTIPATIMSDNHVRQSYQTVEMYIENTQQGVVDAEHTTHLCHIHLKTLYKLNI